MLEDINEEALGERVQVRQHLIMTHAVSTEENDRGDNSLPAANDRSRESPGEALSSYELKTTLGQSDVLSSVSCHVAVMMTRRDYGRRKVRCSCVHAASRLGQHCHRLQRVTLIIALHLNDHCSESILMIGCADHQPMERPLRESTADGELGLKKRWTLQGCQGC